MALSTSAGVAAPRAGAATLSRPTTVTAAATSTGPTRKRDDGRRAFGFIRLLRPFPPFKIPAELLAAGEPTARATPRAAAVIGIIPRRPGGVSRGMRRRLMSFVFRALVAASCLLSLVSCLGSLVLGFVFGGTDIP